ncbi:MAG: hypothetical protein PHE55_05795 [Methylococcaceae bacterium]|nr:hypothetical protein [Methylococcaceae bacterium]
MNSDKANHLKFFLNEVSALYSEIREWISGTNLVYDEEPISINEKNCGKYETKKVLLSKKDGTRIAEIVPIGAWVIGANGRIDFKGLHDQIIIVHLSQGGPAANLTIRDAEGHPVTQSKPLFRGINEEGWYWIEHKLSSKGHQLTAELFFDILADISNYERD